MTISMQMLSHVRRSLDVPNGRLDMELPKEKVLIVMGATGVGKSRLSIDLAKKSPAEIINSDKMQMYQGLDIITNKITEEEQCGITHHLLGILSPNAEFSAANFCAMASLVVESTLARNKLPIIVGGSNSYIEALMDGEGHRFRSKYDCCFLWVDVSIPVLHSFVSERVDRMVESGMVDEARKFFHPNADYSKGIRRAIGVPEFHDYFRDEPFLDEKTKAKLLQKAIQEIKDNTCELACRQLRKIHRLRNIKRWNIQRVDATEVFRKRGRAADEAWKNLVAGPSTTIVEEFLNNFASMEVPSPVAEIRDHSTQCLVV